MAAAHGAKGEAKNAGAARLGALYTEIELKARTGACPSADAYITALDGELRRVEDFINAYMKEAA